MAQTPSRIDILYPEALVDRIEYLSSRNDESRSAIMHRAMAIGVAAMEAEISQHLSFKNGLAISEKLRRRGEAWDQSIALLEAGTDEMREIAKSLRRSAGGE